MSLVHNETTKLTANALDRASTACLTVGVIGPVVATIYNFGGTNAAGHGILLLVGSTGWMIAAGSLHMMARRTLRGLQ